MRNNDTFTDRLEAQAKARQALLEKAKQNDPTNDPEFAARQQAAILAACGDQKTLEAMPVNEFVDLFAL